MHNEQQSKDHVVSFWCSGLNNKVNRRDREWFNDTVDCTELGSLGYNSREIYYAQDRAKWNLIIKDASAPTGASPTFIDVQITFIEATH